MKLEAIRKMKLPKYAAALAALTVSAAMLTGCGETEPDLAGVAQPLTEESMQCEITETTADAIGEMTQS
jgi:hypothetical protein